MQGKTVLISGASTAIGEEFAHQLAIRGNDLVLVPVDEDRFMERPSGGLTVRFRRNRFGNVREFALSVDRARGIVFRKQ